MKRFLSVGDIFVQFSTMCLSRANWSPKLRSQYLHLRFDDEVGGDIFFALNVILWKLATCNLYENSLWKTRLHGSHFHIWLVVSLFVLTVAGATADPSLRMEPLAGFA